MARIMVIVVTVALLVATHVAMATPADQTRLPVTVRDSSEPASIPETIVVEKGDHLWKIAARRLGDGSTNDEIAPYWREVVEINTPLLRSGDPDLIYPGEVVELPRLSPGRP